MKWLGLIELFVVLGFACVWGLLELYVRRFDRKPPAAAARSGENEPPTPG